MSSLQLMPLIQVSLKIFFYSIKQKFCHRLTIYALFIEFMKLKELLHPYNVFRYEPSRESLVKFKDGGVAIIEQIICSHARYS